MDAILHTLNNTPGVETSALVSKEGLVIEQVGRMDNVDTDALAAVASELYASAEAAGEQLTPDGVDHLLLEASGIRCFISRVSGDTFLLVLSRNKLNLGLLRWEVQASADRLRGEL